MVKTDRLKTASRLLRGPICRGLRTMPGLERVVEDGGDYGAGLVRGAAIITRGEALTHYEWIDREMLGQVAAAINADPQGAKSRFGHPGLSSDGIGRYVGRYKNARIDGDIVRADLHIGEAARLSDSPEGDIGAWVLKMANTDPEAFANSIAFDVDAAAMEQFEERNTVDGQFRSPDPANVEHYPHVRLKELTASDIVDEGAANPAGLFSRGRRAGLYAMLQEADSVWLWLVGDGPEPQFFEASEIHPDRIRDNFRRYLERAGLRIVRDVSRHAIAYAAEADKDAQK